MYCPKKIREAVSYVTYQAWIHRIEVTFTTPPVINTKLLFQTQLSVTRVLRSDEFV